MKKTLVLFYLLSCASIVFSQDTSERKKSIYFPYPTENWRSSIGFTFTTFPYDITEEEHFRAPAITYHFIKRVNKNIYVDGLLTTQILQSMAQLGPRLGFKLSKRTAISIGDDASFWFGKINLSGFNTRGYGWQNYPNASIGFRFPKNVRVTIKAEQILTLNVNTRTGDIPVTSKFKTNSGSAYTLVFEQPFYGKKSLSLGFRAIYSSFFWQTWSFFSTFDRNIFYPQVIVGLIL
jgi:hypothetical protein